MTVKGFCKLCLDEKELQRSHLIPKSVYKKSRSGDPNKPHPTVLSRRSSRQSSYQVMDYVFCSHCERSPIEKKNVIPRIPNKNTRSDVFWFSPGIQKICWLAASEQTKVMRPAFFGKLTLPNIYCRRLSLSSGVKLIEISLLSSWCYV